MRTRTPNRVAPVAGCGLLAWVALAVMSCVPPSSGVPLDRPVYPTGLAVHPGGERLVVVSSAFDLAYDDGALLLADLAAVRAGLAATTAEDRRDAVVEGAYVKAARLPPFGDRPTLTSGGERLLVSTRGNNLVSSADLDADGGFSCSSTDDDGTPRCGTSPQALQVPESDPFDVLVLDEATEDGVLTRVDGLVTLLSSPTVYFFHDDRERSGASAMQQTGTLMLGEAVHGVRSAALRTRNGVTHVVAAVDTASLVSAGALLVLFEPRVDAVPTAYDVTTAMGAAALRDLLVVPGAGAEPDAVIVATRAPDAVARFEIDDLPGGPALRLAGVAESCAMPTGLALSTHGGVARVLLTCQLGGTIEALDPRTLAVTDVVRFAGRNPYDVAVNPVQPEAFVSFFLDDTIGVLSLVDSDGATPRMTLQGRIGTPTPKPEDGRE